MYVQQQVDLTGEQEPVLETFAEVQQVWHPLRRKYDLFTRSVELSCCSRSILFNPS